MRQRNGLLFAAAFLGTLSIGLLLLFLPALAQSEPTATPRGSYVIVNSVFVRSGPGESFPSVTALNAGAVVVPLGRDESGQWVQVRVGNRFGWLRRDLAFWIISVDDLPIVDATITPEALITPTATVIFPTDTPEGSWVSSQQGVFVRSGPGLTYDPLGTLTPGTVVEPVGRTNEVDWILIRYGEGFGWVLRQLVRWNVDLRTLPVLMRGNLTPSPTFTRTPAPSSTATLTLTPTVTASLTPTLTASATDVPTATATASLTPTHTLTLTPAPATATLTPMPSLTSTLAPTATETPIPTATILPPTATDPATTEPPTNTAIPSATWTATALPPTATFTETTVPPTATETHTLTPLPSATSTASVEPTTTPTTEPTVTPVPSATQTPEPTTTPIPPTFTDTPSPVPPSATNTSLPTETATTVVIASVPTQPPASVTPVPPSATSASPTSRPTIVPTTAVPTSTDAINDTPTATVTPTDAPAIAIVPTTLPGITAVTTPEQGGGLPPELLAGLFGLLVVGGYGLFYWRGLAAADRYRKGFIIQRCPVCLQGDLVVETKRERLLGIPRPRYAVYCTHCRSVLREAGSRQWRYAVDRLDNPLLYGSLNNHVLSEDQLRELAQSAARFQQPPQPRTPPTPPQFVDDEEPR